MVFKAEREARSVEEYFEWRVPRKHESAEFVAQVAKLGKDQKKLANRGKSFVLGVWWPEIWWELRCLCRADL